MANPFRAWKHQPWRPLFLSALVSVGGFRGLELLLALATESIGLRSRLQDYLKISPMGLIIEFMLYCGLGALAVLLLETKFFSGPIYSSTLWTLLLCIMITLLGLWVVENFLPLPGLGFIDANQVMLAGVAVGIFVNGQRHWR